MLLRRVQKVVQHGGSKIVVIPPDSDLQVGDDVVVTYSEKSVQVKAFKEDRPLTLRDAFEFVASAKNSSDRARKMQELKDRLRAAPSAGQKSSDPQLAAALQVALEAAAEGPAAFRAAAKQARDREIAAELARRRRR
jgi:hypothetical protein